jgi:hypothetical protein
MTSLNLLERMNELSNGVIRPFNATREARRGSISGILAKIQIRSEKPSESSGTEIIDPPPRGNPAATLRKLFLG